MGNFWNIFGFMQEKEIAYQVKEYKERGSFTGSAVATDFVQREALIQQIIAAEEPKEE